jgi:hypothetical protein
MHVDAGEAQARHQQDTANTDAADQCSGNERKDEDCYHSWLRWDGADSPILIAINRTFV